MTITETTLKAGRFCPHCGTWMIPDEKAAYSRKPKAAIGHPGCVRREVEASERRHKRLEALDVGGRAGTYHRGGGRVIRSPKNLA
jgi:hypothetical protein